MVFNFYYCFKIRSIDNTFPEQKYLKYDYYKVIKSNLPYFMITSLSGELYCNYQTIKSHYTCISYSKRN